LTPTPDEPAIFLKEAFERTAARATIQPNCHFIDGWSIGRLENEEECAGRVFLVDWDEAGIHLANIKIHLRKRFDLVSCFSLSYVQKDGEVCLRSVFLLRNRKPSSPPVGVGVLEGQVVGEGMWQLQADETLDATEASKEAAVEGPMQFAAHEAVPVGENFPDDLEVHELQKDSNWGRLSVKWL